jgi:hypothetical protein
MGRTKWPKAPLVFFGPVRCFWARLQRRLNKRGVERDSSISQACRRRLPESKGPYRPDGRVAPRGRRAACTGSRGAKTATCRRYTSINHRHVAVLMMTAPQASLCSKTFWGGSREGGSGGSAGQTKTPAVTPGLLLLLVDHLAGCVAGWAWVAPCGLANGS